LRERDFGCVINGARGIGTFVREASAKRSGAGEESQEMDFTGFKAKVEKLQRG